MSGRLKNTIITDSILAIVVAIIFILDAAGVAFIGAMDRWYLLFLAYISMVFLTVALFYRKSFFIFISAITIGLFASLEFVYVGMYFYQSWYLIPIFGGFGLMVMNALNKGNKNVYLVAVLIMVISIALMASVIENVWRYVLPSIIILLAIFGIVKAALTKTKEESCDSDVLYVEPSDNADIEDSIKDIADISDNTAPAKNDCTNNTNQE